MNQEKSADVASGITQYFGLPEAELKEPLVCHVMQILNISESKEKALEEWRYYQNPNTAPFERMEHVYRPIIYGIDLETPEPEQKARSVKATYKLLLRDCFGNYFYAIELEELPFLRPGTNTTKTPLPIPLGGCITLGKGTLIADGFVLMKKHLCTYQEPDPFSELTKSLNENLVGKNIEMIEHLLNDLK
ncbi:hypothetical protein METBIDRAFT_76668 [Metschnikowia bicuspidata var. bicuspidata NRRL YB-4993]|uniref:RecQ mediated genome instability protein 1 OB-fold domain-containing protein n=1 Tax=Metschnikowia bicuspidata var. bicuspidata NRRL YB-4993 TaxID=869754 RepID=A0A1A0HHQ3_9ASCO|nr:hypothetical protein METBIDRAFT_76668 [Metschnikowia bicuspidata var. bicuspidata NRRL YB-4993]OBA23689.1 hypothetical protein METBIDRAFT_76668 [Metschnikowia bicuspidata var. bicuspidata NRRL YB-4993]